MSDTNLNNAIVPNNAINTNNSNNLNVSNHSDRQSSSLQAARTTRWRITLFGLLIGTPPTVFTAASMNNPTPTPGDSIANNPTTNHNQEGSGGSRTTTNGTTNGNGTNGVDGGGGSTPSPS